MQKRGKILKLFKKKFKFKKYKKIMLLKKKKNKVLYFKNKKNCFFFYNIVHNKFNLYSSVNFYDIKNFFFYNTEQLEVVNDLFYKIKINTNRLLLNVYLKDKLLKTNKLFRKKNLKIFFKFAIFFFKKIVAQKFDNKTAFILIKIKKNQLKKRLKKKKIARKKFLLIKWEPFIKKKILFKIAKLVLIFNFFFPNKSLKIVPIYNKSHSKNTTKFKKKRRK